jgi:hypothetical protein
VRQLCGLVYMILTRGADAQQIENIDAQLEDRRPINLSEDDENDPEIRDYSVTDIATRRG